MPAAPVTVRRAVPDDAAEIVRLKAVLMRTGWPFDVDLDDGWAARAEQVARDLLADPLHGWFVVDGDRPGTLVGCVSVAIHQHLPGPRGTGRSAYLGDMVTESARQGRGVGSALLEHALAWAREQGAGRIELYSTAPGRALYERAGFRRDTLFEHLSMPLG